MMVKNFKYLEYLKYYNLDIIFLDFNRVLVDCIDSSFNIY